MSQIRYIAGLPGRVGAAQADLQLELNDYVLKEQYNFYQNALTYAAGDLVITNGLYGAYPISSDELDEAEAIRSAAGDQLSLVKARQEEILSTPGIQSQLGLDPRFANLVETGTISGPHVGIIPAVVGYIIVAAIVAAVVAGVYEVINKNRLAAGASVEQSKELARLAAMLPQGEQQKLYDEVDRQVKNTYLRGHADSMWSGFSGFALSALILGFGGLWLYNRSKSK